MTELPPKPKTAYVYLLHASIWLHLLLLLLFSDVSAGVPFLLVLTKLKDPSLWIAIPLLVLAAVIGFGAFFLGARLSDRLFMNLLRLSYGRCPICGLFQIEEHEMIDGPTRARCMHCRNGFELNGGRWFLLDAEEYDARYGPPSICQDCKARICGKICQRCGSKNVQEIKMEPG